MKRTGSAAVSLRCSTFALALALPGAFACNRTETGDKSKGTSSGDAAKPSAPKEVVHESGLKIQELDPGTGPEATKGKIVAIHYTGWLPNGNKLDSTRNRQPLQFQLGEGTVMKGWDIGVMGMKVGAKRKLTVPPDLAFGSKDVGEVKAGSTLVFEVELVKIQ